MKHLLIILLLFLTGCSAPRYVVREAMIIGVKDIEVGAKPVKLVEAVTPQGDTITRVLMPVKSVRPGSTLYYAEYVKK